MKKFGKKNKPITLKRSERWNKDFDKSDREKLTSEFNELTTGLRERITLQSFLQAGGDVNQAYVLSNG